MPVMNAFETAAGKMLMDAGCVLIDAATGPRILVQRPTGMNDADFDALLYWAEHKARHSNHQPLSFYDFDKR